MITSLQRQNVLNWIEEYKKIRDEQVLFTGCFLYRSFPQEISKKIFDMYTSFSLIEEYLLHIVFPINEINTYTWGETSYFKNNEVVSLLHLKQDEERYHPGFSQEFFKPSVQYLESAFQLPEFPCFQLGDMPEEPFIIQQSEGFINLMFHPFKYLELMFRIYEAVGEYPNSITAIDYWRMCTVPAVLREELLFDIYTRF
jgi:hypothetical protein